MDAFLRDAAERTGSTIISGHCAALQARAGNSSPSTGASVSRPQSAQTMPSKARQFTQEPQ
ncbi:hypothetical protein HEP84_56565 [Streptomyces sp. RLB1-33]|nr:hypothetical protein [Streptomyces sp. RLB1-33]